MSDSKGKKVSVHYIGTLNDGTVFDSSRKREKPLTFNFGSQQVIRGFEKAVQGMKVGETKKVSITPDQAYGPKIPDLFRQIPKTTFPEDFSFQVGLMVEMKSEKGHPLPATITGVDENEVTLDFNHPLSGETLNFEIEMVETDTEETE